MLQFPTWSQTLPTFSQVIITTSFILKKDHLVKMVLVLYNMCCLILCYFIHVEILNVENMEF